MKSPATRNEYSGVDLHCHTNKSDGIGDVESLVADAVAKKLDFVAVTEHDFVNREAMPLLRNSGIESCESVEISARDYDKNHSLHIVFYAKKINARVDEILTGVRNGRIDKVRQQCERLSRNGFVITLEDLVRQTMNHRMSPDCLTNSHIADYLISTWANRARMREITGKSLRNKGEVIETFLKNFSEYREMGFVQVADYEPSVELVAELAVENHAVASVAHPNFSFLHEGGIPEFESRMRKYASLGITWIEVNPFADSQWLKSIRSTAQRTGMILTFGSDSHGYSDESHNNLGGIHQITRTEPEILQKSMEDVFSIIRIATHR